MGGLIVGASLAAAAVGLICFFTLRRTLRAGDSVDLSAFDAAMRAPLEERLGNPPPSLEDPLLRAIEAATCREVFRCRLGAEGAAAFSFAIAVAATVFGFVTLLGVIGKLFDLADGGGTASLDMTKALLGAASAILGLISVYVSTNFVKSFELSLTHLRATVTRAENVMSLMMARRMIVDAGEAKREDAILEIIKGFITAAKGT